MVKRLSFGFLKLALLGLAVYFIYQKVKLSDLESLEWNFNANSLKFITFFFLAWALNFTLDAKAWQIVQSSVLAIPLKTAVIHNLKCYGLAFITPFNSGEIAGRYLIQENPEHRKKAVFLTFWTHAPKIFSKALVSFIILTALLLNNTVPFYWSLLSIIAAVSTLLLFLNLQIFISFLEKQTLWKRPLKDYIVPEKPILKHKLQTLGLNGLRFMIFSSQLALVLLAFKPGLLSLDLFWSIPLFYFAAALLPNFSALDFIIKGTLSLYFFAIFETDALSFALAGTVVWMFNLALPALLGLSTLKREDLAHLKRKKT
jgi:hypothetical protein